MLEYYRLYDISNTINNFVCYLLTSIFKYNCNVNYVINCLLRKVATLLYNIFL